MHYRGRREKPELTAMRYAFVVKIQQGLEELVHDVPGLRLT